MYGTDFEINQPTCLNCFHYKSENYFKPLKLFIIIHTIISSGRRPGSSVAVKVLSQTYIQSKFKYKFKVNYRMY